MLQQRAHLLLGGSRAPQLAATAQGPPCLPRARRRPTHHHVLAEPEAGEASTSDPYDPYQQYDRPRPRVTRYQRPVQPTYTPPSVRETSTLRPGPEWYPEWMQYRRREDNYIFWQDKFSRCSVDIPEIEKRWTVFSSLWWLVMEFKYMGVPPAFRYIFFLLWRPVQQKIYEAHKALVLWQCQLDSWLASKGSDGLAKSFSRCMALRRLHWKNCLLGELLYALNLWKTGRVHMLPPEKRPFQRPTFFFLF